MIVKNLLAFGMCSFFSQYCYYKEFTRVHTWHAWWAKALNSFPSSSPDQQGLRVWVRDGYGGHPQADQIHLRQPRKWQRVLLHPGGAGHSAAGESLAQWCRTPWLTLPVKLVTSQRNATLFLVLLNQWRSSDVLFCICPPHVTIILCCYTIITNPLKCRTQS